MAKNTKNNNTNNNKNNGKNFITKNRFWVGALMLVLSLLVSIFVLPKLATTKEYTIYALKNDVSNGTVISSEMLTPIKTSDSTLYKLAVSESDLRTITAEGYCAKHNLSQGYYLLDADLMKSDGTGTTDIVPKNKQIISVPVSSIYSSVSYTIRKGDVIRFYSTYEDERNGIVAYIPSTLNYVEIYEVYDSGGIACSKSGAAPSSISLVVNQTQALDIVTLINTSKVYYSLMSSGDEEMAQKFLNHQEQILKGEIDANNEIVDVSDVDISGSIDENANTNENTNANENSNN